MSRFDDGAVMFGYIKTNTPELLVKENEFYRALYCGLCRTMGRMNKAFSFSLSYDFVFLALVRMGLSDEKIEFGKKRCVAHPSKKRPYVKENEALRYTASAASLLLYCNLLDDVEDEKGARRLFSKLCLPSARRLLSKTKRSRDIDDVERVVKSELCRITDAEAARADSPYVPAEHFGRLLGKIFSHDIENEGVRRCLYELGSHIGRWIYIVDALDDIEGDLKSGSYNPFIVSGEYLTEGFDERISDALKLELGQAIKALDLIDFSDQGILSIIHNIICLGMPAEVDRILKKTKNAGSGKNDARSKRERRHK